MGKLGQLDLNQVPAESDRFLARVLQVGCAQNLLPAAFPETIRAFLRAHAMSQARRHRSGIAIDRESLEPGVRQGFTCVEVALQHAASGDLRQAIEQLNNSDLEHLRRQGWERTWQALDEMRQESTALLRDPVSDLLAEWHVDLRRWATLVPETLMATDADEKAVRVDPVEEYPGYRGVAQRGWFLQRLPRAAIRSLLAVWPARADFHLFLRQLLAALALERLSLPVSTKDVERFSRECFDKGCLRPEIRERVQVQFREHLLGSIPEGRAEPWLPRQGQTSVEVDFQETITDLERVDAAARPHRLALQQ